MRCIRNRLLWQGNWYTNNNVGGANLVGMLGGNGSSVSPIPLDGGATKVIADTIQTTFNEAGGLFDIVQEVYPVQFRESGQVVWRVKIVNHSLTTLAVNGLQYLNDLQAGDNDNPLLVERNYFDGTHWRVASKDGTSPNPPSLYVEIDKDSAVSKINLFAVGYTNDSFPPLPLGLTPCSGFAVGSWQGGAVGQQLLDYIFGCPAPPIPNATRDMACVLQWTPKNVPASKNGGDTTVEEFRTSFGSYGTSCSAGFLMLDFVPLRIDYNPMSRTLAPNPFNVLSLRINLTDSNAANVFDTELCLTNNLSGIGVQPSNGIGRVVPSSGLADFLWRDSLIRYDTNIWIQFHDHAQGLDVSELACGKIFPIVNIFTATPTAQILSRAGSYDGSICNNRLTLVRVYDTGTPRSSISAATDSAVNMKVSIPINKKPIDTLEYTVQVIDSMHDGFAIVSVRDTFNHVTHDTVRYCTIADTYKPILNVPMNWPSGDDSIIITDNRPWDRGIKLIALTNPKYDEIDTFVVPSSDHFTIHNTILPPYPSKQVCIFAIDVAGNSTDTCFNIGSTQSVSLLTIDSIDIAPNPTADFITILLSDETPRLLTLQNLLGRTVLQSTIRGTGELDLSKLAPGTYILRVGGVTRKIIKE